MHMASRPNSVVLLVVFACLISACESARIGNILKRDAPSLNGTSWTLASYGPKDRPITVVASVGVTLTFDETGQRASGKSGCNRYSASVTLDGRRITIGPTVGTRMSCAPECDETERNYLGALAGTSVYRITGDVLTIEYNDNEALVFEAGLPES